MSNLVEFDRSKVMNMGGTLYIKIPLTLKRKLDLSIDNEAIWKRESDASLPVIDIQPKTEGSN